MRRPTLYLLLTIFFFLVIAGLGTAITALLRHFDVPNRWAADPWQQKHTALYEGLSRLQHHSGGGREKEQQQEKMKLRVGEHRGGDGESAVYAPILSLDVVHITDE
ncbi:hypothetical protein F4778DRAFT_779619 [Xylariomycetidae sp. FL2044]|nr:hypothetical protein F4778DRAFT_779619 [Xylariomycetidae sp. FL2044]